KVISELTALSSMFVLPLISIVLALVYLKMRQLGGEPLVALGADVRESRAALDEGSASSPSFAIPKSEPGEHCSIPDCERDRRDNQARRPSTIPERKLLIINPALCCTS